MLRRLLNLISLNNWQFVAFRYNGTYIALFVNGTYVKSTVASGNTGHDMLLLAARHTDYGAFTGKMDEFGIWTRALTEAEISELYNNYEGYNPFAGGDPTPPTISNLNCTSCDIPNGDITPPYETEDTTPTFKFDTDENAWCAISDSDDNYTIMGASRNCTSGEGTQNHICTLTVQDRFSSVGENYLYISCKDSDGNEGNATDSSKSNSGKIRMEILGAGEASGDDRIEIGIDTSDIKDIATKYSEQQLSARNLNNDQFTGTFDWVVVVQGSTKRYAFNYVSGGESPISNLFNLTPVLYVLQLQNQTNETITDDVGKLINSTWP